MTYCCFRLTCEGPSTLFMARLGQKSKSVRRLLDLRGGTSLHKNGSLTALQLRDIYPRDKYMQAMLKGKTLRPDRRRLRLKRDHFSGVEGNFSEYHLKESHNEEHLPSMILVWLSGARGKGGRKQSSWSSLFLGSNVSANSLRVGLRVYTWFQSGGQRRLTRWCAGAHKKGN